MAMPVPGKKWKPGDPPPKREDYANSQDYENADSEYRRWKLDQKRDATGGVSEKAANQTGKVVGDRVNGVTQVKDATAPVVLDQDAELRKLQEAASATGAAKPKPAADEDAEPKREDFPEGLPGVAAWNKAMSEYRKKKKISMGPQSPYPEMG